MSLLDKWNKNKFTVYDSQEKSALGLISQISKWLSDIILDLNSKTDLYGDHKGSWQGLNRPTMSEEGMRATVEKLDSDFITLSNDVTSLNDEIKKKVSYPIENWEGTNVKNLNYQYGDIRRYGALCDGITDDSSFLQITFDICGLNGKPIYIPSENILVKNPIILRDYNTHVYNVRGVGTKTLDKNLICDSQYLFIGEKFYNSTPYFTMVNLNMMHVNIKCNTNVNVTIFKAIELYHSLIKENKIYYANIVIEGALSVWTNFTRNRIQGLKRTFIMSSATRQGVNIDNIILQLIESNFDYSILSSYLVINPNTNSYTIKSNDSYVKNNYFSGSYTQTTLPTLLEIDAIDVDCNFEDNWIEFFEYLTKPLTQRNTVNESKFIYGTLFVNNTIQRFYRLFDEDTQYNSWVFENNKFMGFSSTSLTSQFPNAINPKFKIKKCGPVVVDRVDNDTSLLYNMVFNNNQITGSDYSYYIDVGTSTKKHSIKEKGTKILQGIPGVTNAVHFRISVQGTNDTYIKSHFELLDNKVYTSLPTINDTSFNYINVFLGQRLFVGTDVYIMGLDGEGKPSLIKIN